MEVLVIDNYDSFTYNIVDAMRRMGVEPKVVRNDKIDPESIARFDRIILSPGPGIPAEAGRMMEVIARWHQTKPILGICLGHQAIAEYFGAKLTNLAQVYHGVALPMDVIAPDTLFEGLPDRITVGRYHSWAVDPQSIPPDLEVTAKATADGNVMAIRHRRLNIRGVQFHPESILTEHGLQMLKNWIE